MTTLTILACYVAAHWCVLMPSSVPSMTECQAAIDEYEVSLVDGADGLTPVGYRCTEDK